MYILLPYCQQYCKGLNCRFKFVDQAHISTAMKAKVTFQ